MKRNRLRTKIFKIIGLALLVYLTFSVGKVAFQNWEFNETAKELEKEIELLETENMNLKNKILYYKTTSYKERIMRERLGYKKPGEEVIVLMSGGESDDEEVNKGPKISNAKKWWRFLFPRKEESD